MASRASLDLEGGHVQIAARRVRVRALGARGHLQVGDDDGPVLRPPTFGERTRLVASALGSTHPSQRLAAALVRALRARAGSCDAAAERVVALLLAGAGDAGPPLVDTACLVARASGSSLDAVESLEATAVDFYARRLTSDVSQDDGWHRVVLAEAAPDAVSAEGADDDAIVMELAEVLLDRGRAWGSAELREAAAGKGAHDAVGAHAHGAPDGQGGAVEPDESSDNSGSDTPWDSTTATEVARTPRDPRHEDALRGAPLLNTRDEELPVAAPRLRFRQAASRPYPPRTPEGDAPANDRTRVAASPVGATGSVPARPSTPRSLTDRLDWNPAEWNPGPWRLDRAPHSALAVSPSAAPRLGAGWPTRLPNATVTVRAASPAVAARSADDMADALADSLRREATRRGLVP